MKTIINISKFGFFIFLSLQLVSCSSSDGEDEGDFEPIEITFTEDFFTDCDQIKTIDKVKLAYRKVSENEDPYADTFPVTYGGCGFIGYNDFMLHDGIYFLFLGNHLEIDLTELYGASKVILSIDDNCGIGCTKANMYKNGEVIKTQFNTSRNYEDIVFNLSEGVEKITIASLEGWIYKIVIE